MTTSRSPKTNARPRLPMIAATTAALPAVVLSSLAIAQPAAAESRPRVIPATLAAAIQAQAQGQTVRSLSSALIPAGFVPAAVPAAFRPAQVSAPAEYTIARGDTISGIAGKFGLDTYAILKLNGLQSNTIIYPGQKIKLGGSGEAPAPAAPAAPAPSAAAGSAYTVKSGDTLSAIAARHGVKLSEVLGWNGLNMGSIIYPGQQIKIGGGAAAPAPSAPAPAPAAPAPAPAAPASASYTIKSGDTLSAIAARNGVKLADILSANRLTMSSIIYPGQKLALTGSPSTPSSVAPAATPPAATVTPLVPGSFLGFTYPAAVVSSANANKALLNASPVPSREQMKSIVADTARRMGVDPSLAMAFAFQESSFDHRSVSPANAIGTMQVIPSSGEWASDLVGRRLNLLDPYDNATAGVAIIRQLIRSSPDLDTAIAGYYQGQYSVSKYGMYDDTKRYVASIKSLQKTFG
ncbi:MULTISPECIES: lytic transglycosylase domain-containing protein [Micrococcaceae]|uniref:lytic transglycosylase domain-containing protein n=3 Tax=Micrococcales TaxID=85006 RepID=UPI00249F6DED|nr:MULTISPECIES: lytic transglycosylase domain-containing protein [Micrococcaceae]MDJ0353427.1 LysM peptidoglycan-binding domain-containing protein [Pseudarthrobacter sp. PH31-O2]WGZ80548.1 LysM peptidoglycan-binding domain-containing protein [Arthrobacter sp. EM1]